MAQLILQPCANKDSRKHYADTVSEPVPLSRLRPFLSSSDFKLLEKTFGLKSSVPLWGATPGKKDVNKKKWAKINPGDHVFFARNKQIISQGKICLTLQDKNLAKELWGETNDGETWEFIYFIKELIETELPQEVFNKAAGYKSNFVIQGFSVLPEVKSNTILSKLNLEVTTSNATPNFKIGEVYNRQSDIHDKFGGSRMSGISPSADFPIIFVFTGNQGRAFGYKDSWNEDNGVFSYTGEGQKGDMTFTKGNKALRDHSENGKEVFLFKSLGKSKGYEFLGQFICGSWQREQGLDQDQKTRSLIIFDLVRIGHTDDADIDIEIPIKTPLKALRKAAEEAAKPSAKKSSSSGSRASFYERSTAVKVYALARAKGMCECCEKPAPFKTKNGSPFLEVHHIHSLSDGGLDHPRWVAAICPNCHRAAHHSTDRTELNSRLADKVKELENKADELNAK